MRHHKNLEISLIAALEAGDRIMEIYTSNEEQEREAEESQKNISLALKIPLDQLKVDILDSKIFSEVCIYS